MKNQQRINFSETEASHKNREADLAIKTVVTMTRTILIQAALIRPEETLYTDLWPMEMDYAVWVYNSILDMQSGLPAIEIW